MLKEFILKQMIKRQMPQATDAQIDQVISLVSKNPELFQKIAEEVQARVKNGEDQTKAMMAVMQKYQEELKAVAGK